MKNPFKNRDLHTELSFPTMSPSSMASFLYDPESWYMSYVRGIRSIPNERMKGGIFVGEKIVRDPKYLPSVERPELFEHRLEHKLGNIHIKGHLDGWSPSVPAICEYKTSANAIRWNQKKVDTLDQLTFYCLLVYLNYNILPEKLRLRLWAIPMKETKTGKIVQKGKPVCYTTKRTIVEVLQFAAKINKVHKQMQDYIKNHD